MNKLYVVGIGPGDYSNMTIRADRVLRECDLIIGYTVYVELVKSYYADKEFLSTPMTKEEERCRIAFEQAKSGKTTAMICSGDAGVYGMSGLIYAVGSDYPDVTIEVVPGVTAALAGGAVLGAPLIHDFAVISLSDLLTPWEKIEKRLRAAAEADFVVCLYNPSSKKRKTYMHRACSIMLEYKDNTTVCGYVKNIGREGEAYHVLSLEALKDSEVDMFTTVFIGNTKTVCKDGKMVTPRGYRNE